ncbi:predicted protein [Histoplasma capsulatum H143]|uniref:Uncharacterized protein n=1 Tax=Ajellomyces capsulatus (strain H143) TaxID=544712 RepID=C6HR93_AJECH|nr:predicted protein [Histoplasma capsulatum H143]
MIRRNRRQMECEGNISRAIWRAVDGFEARKQPTSSKRDDSEQGYYIRGLKIEGQLRPFTIQVSDVHRSHTAPIRLGRHSNLLSRLTWRAKELCVAADFTGPGRPRSAQAQVPVRKVSHKVSRRLPTSQQSPAAVRWERRQETGDRQPG